MKDFTKGGFRDGGRGGRGGFGDRGSRPGFAKKPWDKKPNRFGGDKQLFRATCAGCGKPCEVPFRLVDGRPVFCSDCFMSHKPEMPRDDFKPKFKKDFNQGSVGGETYRAATPDPRMDAVMKQLDAIQNTLERLVAAMPASSMTNTIVSETESPESESVAEKKPFKMKKKVATAKKTKKAKKK